MLTRILAFVTLLSISSLTLSEPWQVWGNGSLPPMGYMENDQAKGFGVEITQAVFEEAGIEYTIILAPWKRAYVEAELGHGLVFGMYWTQDRSKLFDYSIPLWTEEVVLVTNKGQEFEFNKIDDLKGKTISFQRGTRSGTEFEHAIKSKLFKAKPNNDPVNRLRMLNLDRIEAAIFNPGLASVVWNAQLAKLPMSFFSVLKKPLAVENKHIAISKSLNKTDLIHKLNAAIEKLKKNGTIREILRRYESS